MSRGFDSLGFKRKVYEVDDECDFSSDLNPKRRYQFDPSRLETEVFFPPASANGDSSHPPGNFINARVSNFVTLDTTQSVSYENYSSASPFAAIRREDLDSLAIARQQSSSTTLLRHYSPASSPTSFAHVASNEEEEDMLRDMFGENCDFDVPITSHEDAQPLYSPLLSSLSVFSSESIATFPQCAANVNDMRIDQSGILPEDMLTSQELSDLYLKASRHDNVAFKKLESLVETSYLARGFFMALFAAGQGAKQCRERAERISGEHLFSWLLKQSEADMYATFLLGICYYHGVDRNRNVKTAQRLFKQSTARGYAPAQFYLGHCFEQYKGRAIEWYKLAAEQGHCGALCAWGDLCMTGKKGIKHDPAEAIRLYTIAAEQYQDVLAMNTLGWWLKRGIGAAKDLQKAAAYYHAAADLGYVPAMSNIGHCYAEGEGVIKDQVKAVKYFLKGAEGGNSDAMYRLACCYDKGEGIKCQPSEAVRWYRAAADEGHAAAQNELGYILQYGEHGEQKDLVKAVRLYREATKKCHSSAMHNLGYCYYHGVGVPRDFKKAAKYFDKAVERNLSCPRLR